MVNLSESEYELVQSGIKNIINGILTNKDSVSGTGVELLADDIIKAIGGAVEKNYETDLKAMIDWQTRAQKVINAARKFFDADGVDFSYETLALRLGELATALQDGDFV